MTDFVTGLLAKDLKAAIDDLIDQIDARVDEFYASIDKASEELSHEPAEEEYRYRIRKVLRMQQRLVQLKEMLDPHPDETRIMLVKSDHELIFKNPDFPLEEQS